MPEFLRWIAIARARRCVLVLWLALAGSASASVAAPVARPRPETFASVQQSSVANRLLLWIPNRIFDLLDIVRLRARVGPGISASVRATEAADVALGAHLALFAGLPGPRGERSIPLPIGLEGYAGLEVSVLEVGGEDDEIGPRYGEFEIGAGAQVLLAGLDVGIDPSEALDFLAGLVLFDPKKDDF